MPELKPVRIFHIDDHLLFTQGVYSLLYDVPEITWLGSATNMQQGLQGCRVLQPDLLLLDYFLPDGNGLDLAKQLMQEDPSLHIIFLTMENSRSIMQQCKEMGIGGYLLKSTGRTELLDAIKTVQQRQQYYMWRQPDNLPLSEHDKLQRLSKREREIVLLVCEGMTTAEIADKLNLSQLTVSTHRKNLLRKLDLKNAAQLAMLATRIKEMDR